MQWLRPRASQIVAASYNCDNTTGQVYFERTCSGASSDDRNWAWQPRTQRTHEKANVSTIPGPRSLKDSAIEVILKNISEVTFEAFQCIPTIILRQISKEVAQRSLLTLENFKSFSKLLSQEAGATLKLLRYRQNIKEPSSLLPVYVNPLTSQSFDFITSLSITAAFPLPELVMFSNITNIGILGIINSDPMVQTGVGDRLIRAWHLAAIEGAFEVLRILRLYGFEQVTSESMSYLNSFPALAIYDVSGGRFNREPKTIARSLGWTWKVGNVLDLLEAACTERAAHFQKSFGLEAAPRKWTAKKLPGLAKTSRIPRTEVPSFLAQPEAAETSQPPHKDLKLESTPKAEAVEKSINHKTTKEAPIKKLPKRQSPKEWQTDIDAFTRIGELRNDTDLSRAGVEVGDQAIVDNELVNSVPIAHLRLGPDVLARSVNRGDSISDSFYTPFGQTTRKPETGGSRFGRLCFVRIEVPTVSLVPSTDMPPSTSIRERGSVGSTPVAAKRVASGMLRSTKKQRLANVLDSFL